MGPHIIPEVEYDAVMVESTYGDRVHPTPNNELDDIITRTISRGGTVLIPAFAVDRTEVILMALDDAMESGAIPRVPIYVDSPMAIEALTVYRHAIDNDHTEIQPEIRDHLSSRDVFDPGTLEILRTPDESKSINNAPSCIIISASGMATGGRVVHHLKRLLPDPSNTVVLAGFQTPGTRGASLRDGAASVRIHGEEISVQAEIDEVEYFSVHADKDDVRAWLHSAVIPPKKIILVHGEDDARGALRAVLEPEFSIQVLIPGYEETLPL